MRSAPTYATPAEAGVVGDDPLGLASTSEALYGFVFPGINNVVRYIRVYSAMCWAAWRVQQAFEAGTLRDTAAAGALSKAMFQKVEIALNWANQHMTAVPAKGLAGSQRKFPAHGSAVPLNFAALGTSTVSLMEAVNYRPSLTSGLGFLEPRDFETFECSPSGLKMAMAFDAVVQVSMHYKWFADPSRTTGRRSQVASLLGGLDVSKPSARERAVFLDAFFPEDTGGRAQAVQVRCQSLLLTLRSVRAICDWRQLQGLPPWADEETIRKVMARGLCPTGRKGKLQTVSDATTDRVQRRWAVLHVRQLQRLAQEALYCVVEHDARRTELADPESGGQAALQGGVLVEIDTRTLQSCLDRVSRAAVAMWREPAADKIEKELDALRDLQGQAATLYEAAARRESQSADGLAELDIFAHIHSLRRLRGFELAPNGGSEAAAQAVRGLLFCVVETANLNRLTEGRASLLMDGDRCSLLQLERLVTQFKEESIEDLLRHFLKHWVVLRHFEVAALRSLQRDGKNRFRLVIGDQGLQTFDLRHPLYAPTMAEDRLSKALMLCEQAKLLDAGKDETYALTGKGVRRLLRAEPAALAVAHGV